MQETNPTISFEDIEVAFAAKSDHDVKKAYHLFKLFNSSTLVNWGSGLTQIALKIGLPVKPIIKKTIFELFCGGENLEEIEQTVLRLANDNIKSILVYSVEAKYSEKDYDHTVSEILKSFEYAKGHKSVMVVAVKITGIGRFGLFARLHGGAKLEQGEQAEFERVRERMHKICSAAEKVNTGVFFDAEETWIQNPLDELIDEMMAAYNRKKPIVYNTIQLYTTNRLEYLKTAFEKAKSAGYIYGAKLVRGAYMEKERDRAKRLGYPSPIHKDKKGVDTDYNKAIDFCLANREHLAFCAATHNEYSSMYLAQLLIEQNVPRDHPHIFFSQLYGMGEHITYNLAKHGFVSTKWISYGPVKEVIPYLIRRAQENSSVGGQVSRELTLLSKEIKRRDI